MEEEQHIAALALQAISSVTSLSSFIVAGLVLLVALVAIFVAFGVRKYAKSASNEAIEKYIKSDMFEKRIKKSLKEASQDVALHAMKLSERVERPEKAPFPKQKD